MAALAGALVAGGVLGVIASLRPVPVEPALGPRRSTALLHRVRAIPPRTRVLALVGVGAGVLVAVVTGWLVAVIGACQVVCV